MYSITTHDSITKLYTAVHEAADAIIKAKLVPEQPVQSVAAMLAANANDLNTKLRGSLLRLRKPTGVEYRVVPAGSDEVLKSGGAKLGLRRARRGGAHPAARALVLRRGGGLPACAGRGAHERLRGSRRRRRRRARDAVPRLVAARDLPLSVPTRARDRTN